MTDTPTPERLTNIYRSLAKSTAALETVRRSQACLETEGVLSPADRDAVGLCVAAMDGCSYCCQAHGSLAERHGLERTDIAALVCQGEPQDPRLRLISRATRAILETRGKLGMARRRDLIAAGLTESELLELVALIGLYTMATLAANLDDTPVDPDLRAFSAEELARLQASG